MSARPHHRVLVRLTWKLSGATWFWLVEASGEAVPVYLRGRTNDGRPVLSLREPLP